MGGFESLGTRYEPLPFEVVWANEFNDRACQTYDYNFEHEIICADVWHCLESIPGNIDVIIGGFPCQDISINNFRGRGVEGERSGLYAAMVEAIRRCRPRAFVAENVRGLFMKRNRTSLERVIRDFSDLGYFLSVELYNAADYGVAQTRERVFIVGSRDWSFTPPKPICAEAAWTTSQEAISDLAQHPRDEEWSHIWSLANSSPEQGNRRLKADRPAYTIRAECHGNIQFHYELDRRISMREAARIQSFPDDFFFRAKLRETERQIGNAVPPVLGWHIARALARGFESQVDYSTQHAS